MLNIYSIVSHRKFHKNIEYDWANSAAIWNNDKWIFAIMREMCRKQSKYYVWLSVTVIIIKGKMSKHYIISLAYPLNCYLSLWWMFYLDGNEGIKGLFTPNGLHHHHRHTNRQHLWSFWQALWQAEWVAYLFWPINETFVTKSLGVNKLLTLFHRPPNHLATPLPDQRGGNFSFNTGWLLLYHIYW